MEERKPKLNFDFLLQVKFKFVFTTLMSILAFVLFVINKDQTHVLCLYAVLLSTIGDLLLMNIKNIPNRIFKGKHFYVGMIAFALSHILYFVCFSTILASFSAEITIAAFNTMIVFLIMGYVAIILAKNKPSVFLIFVGIYSLIISINIFQISRCAYELGGHYILALIGIILFAISDFLIIVRETRFNKEFVCKLIWVFYPIGQLLIILSI